MFQPLSLFLSILLNYYFLFIPTQIYVLHSEEKQKSIDIESICQLLDLVLGSHFRAQVDYFIEYLKVSCLPSLMLYIFWAISWYHAISYYSLSILILRTVKVWQFQILYCQLAYRVKAPCVCCPCFLWPILICQMFCFFGVL